MATPPSSVILFEPRQKFTFSVFETFLPTFVLWLISTALLFLFFVESSVHFPISLDFIAENFQIQSVNGQKFDVMYLGTVDGNVLKVVNTGDNVTVVQTTRIFAHPQPVVRNSFIEHSKMNLFR